ncbi:hypothetical protein B9Z55_011648 [Caenorhabditis nigoni]|nr:hypothetical protein B9Z55_011648 [Caenorhabditis nigoni]
MTREVKEFDKYYDNHKERIHLHNAHKTMEKLRCNNMNRDQRMAHYKQLIAHIQEILDLPAPVDNYYKLVTSSRSNFFLKFVFQGVDETIKRYKSIDEREAELHRLYGIVQREPIDFSGPIINMCNSVKNSVTGICGSMEKRIGRK